MNALNAVLLKLTNLLLAPFMALPAQVALIVLSIIAGVLAALAFRYTSNQDALKRVADQVRASLLAMRLFKDDLRSVFRAQLSLFTASGLRLWYSLPPLVVLIVPFVLLLSQLAMWYEFKPAAPGEAVLVEVTLSPASWINPTFEMITPDVITNEQSVRDANNHTITYRLRPHAIAVSQSPVRLYFALDNKNIAEKQLVVSDTGGKNELLFVSPLRPDTSFWDRLLYPGEPAFAADSPIKRIEIRYGSRDNTVCGLNIHWLVTFFVVSILAALALKPFIKVQF